MENLHAHNRKTMPELDEHMAFLLSLKNHVYNISDHDLLIRGEIEAQPVELMQASNSILVDEDYVQLRVLAVQERLAKESKILDESVKQAGTYKTSYYTGKKKHWPTNCPLG